jgi:hypothetical protein
MAHGDSRQGSAHHPGAGDRSRDARGQLRSASRSSVSLAPQGRSPGAPTTSRCSSRSTHAPGVDRRDGRTEPATAAVTSSGKCATNAGEIAKFRPGRSRPSGEEEGPTRSPLGPAALALLHPSRRSVVLQGTSGHPIRRTRCNGLSECLAEAAPNRESVGNTQFSTQNASTSREGLPTEPEVLR